VLLDTLPHGVAVVDAHGVVVATNRLWRLAEGEDDLLVQPVGAPLLAGLRDPDRGPSAVAEHTADGLDRLLDGRGHSFQVQYQLAPPDELAEPRWFLVAAEALPDHGLVVTRTETTVHHGVNEVLAELAFHDDLTGLPNRGLLLDRMRMALIRAQRLALRPLIVFGDLDGFKAVNDRYGHDAGDEVLVEAARRLSHAVREGDTCGRWGGDEFVLVVELGQVDAATKVIQRVVDAMAAPFVLRDGSSHRIGLSIGAVVADGSERVETLIAAADRAMYRSKREGRGPVVEVPG
ncbi:MAG TPA: diguanylate cyclase, partial [Iamia sp.]|nr:diguanylate cyclase [Iamia sp.]